MLTLEGTENEDEYAEFLVPEEQISQFWNLNAAFVETFRKFIYSWSVKLAKIIKLKFSKNDRNLLPRKRVARPPIKTIKRRESSDDEDIKQKIKEKDKDKNKKKTKEVVQEEQYIEEETEGVIGDEGEEEQN